MKTWWFLYLQCNLKEIQINLEGKGSTCKYTRGNTCILQTPSVYSSGKKRSAKMSEASFSSRAEKLVVPWGLPVAQLLLWFWTRKAASEFLSLAKLMLFLNYNNIASTCEQTVFLLVINQTAMEFRSGMIGQVSEDYCNWQRRLCRSFQTRANKIFMTS